MSEDDINHTDYNHTEVSGAINQHTPSYWRLALPALGARYVARYVQALRKLPHQYFDAAAGLWMFGVTAFFAHRTAQDMRTIFSEAVAYETDKKPGEVGFTDIMQSDNKAVATARSNFIKYTGLRALVNSTFFVSFLPGKAGKNWLPFRETPSVDLGVGLNGAYLVSEVLGHGRTFFEQTQSFVDSKLNQDKALGDSIKPIDLISLFERNALDNDKQNAFNGQTDGQIWKQSQVIFERMTDLMNHTYQRQHNGDKANFTLPKFLYLIGHNLIQPKKVEQTLAYIEVSNRYGMPALKQVVKAVNDGVTLNDALAQYPITFPEQLQALSLQEQQTKKHTDGLQANGAASRTKPVAIPANFQQNFAAKGDKTFADRYADKALADSQTQLAMPD